MKLPVMPPVLPMLAKLAREMPSGGNFVYEPKWDGFRCIIFRDGDEIELASRNTKPLNRYFPELIEGLKAVLPDRCVIDGEIVVLNEKGLDFDALQLRVHPAASRVEKLSKEIPAGFVAFDILALGDDDLRERTFAERRQLLQKALAGAGPPIMITPATDDRDVADQWFEQFEGAGLDGVVAKSITLPYSPNKRTMIKIKHQRTADCVVAGFRWHKTGPVVGSLQLGLYDDDETLHSVGVTSSFTAAKRKELVEFLEPYRKDALENHPWAEWAAPGEDRGRMPGAKSRWTGSKDMSWEPLRPELVVEVAYDQLQGDRFRHSPTFLRWRTDRDPETCKYDQLESPVKFVLATLLATT